MLIKNDSKINKDSNSINIVRVAVNLLLRFVMIVTLKMFEVKIKKIEIEIINQTPN